MSKSSSSRKELAVIDGQLQALFSKREQLVKNLRQEPCQHEDFACNVAVARILETDGPGISFMAEVTVNCAQCGLPFEFKGLPVGLHMSGAACSFDGIEARLAISPRET